MRYQQQQKKLPPVPQWARSDFTGPYEHKSTCIICTYIIPPLSLISDFGKQNTRGDVSKIFVNHTRYQQIGSKSTNHSPLAWRKEGQKVILAEVIGGFRSDLSTTRKTDENFGNVSAGVLFPKVAHQRKWWKCWLFQVSIHLLIPVTNLFDSNIPANLFSVKCVRFFVFTETEFPKIYRLLPQIAEDFRRLRKIAEDVRRLPKSA